MFQMPSGDTYFAMLSDNGTLCIEFGTTWIIWDVWATNTDILLCINGFEGFFPLILNCK